MLETGRVTDVKGKIAFVSMQPEGGCAGCNRCFKRDGGNELMTENPVGAVPGDVVEVQLSARSRLVAMIVVFLIPLAALGLGLWIGSFWGELWMFLTGVICLVLSYTIVWAIDKLLKKKRNFMPVIIKIKEKNNE